jgi:hypothetical protein
MAATAANAARIELRISHLLLTRQRSLNGARYLFITGLGSRITGVINQSVCLHAGGVAFDLIGFFGRAGTASDHFRRLGLPAARCDRTASVGFPHLRQLRLRVGRVRYRRDLSVMAITASHKWFVHVS